MRQLSRQFSGDCSCCEGALMVVLGAAPSTSRSLPPAQHVSSYVLFHAAYQQSSCASIHLAWFGHRAGCWHGGEGKYYLQMICGLHAVLGAFLIAAARHPSEHRSLISFTIWSSVVQACIVHSSVSGARQWRKLVELLAPITSRRSISLDMDVRPAGQPPGPKHWQIRRR
jgi:hypothetical protein